MKKYVTIGLLLAFTAILLLWDIYVGVTAPHGDTISEVTLAFAQQHPALPYAIGVVCGHVLWPQRAKRRTTERA